MSELKQQNLDSEIDKVQIAHSIQLIYSDNFVVLDKWINTACILQTDNWCKNQKFLHY